MSDVCISAITQAELLFGVARKPESKMLRVAVERFLDHVDVLAWGSKAAEQYALLRAGLERRGLALGSLDMLIAAHALATESVLVSSDRAFLAVERLRVEDWTKGR